ncbi:unnamed protein product, partial [Allacma fusca]
MLYGVVDWLLWGTGSKQTLYSIVGNKAVGGVVAAIAQVLTVLGAAKCVRRVTNSSTLPVHLHIGFALLLSNLLLLLAVH